MPAMSLLHGVTLADSLAQDETRAIAEAACTVQSQPLQQQQQQQQQQWASKAWHSSSSYSRDGGGGGGGNDDLHGHRSNEAQQDEEKDEQNECEKAEAEDTPLLPLLLRAEDTTALLTRLRLRREQASRRLFSQRSLGTAQPIMDGPVLLGGVSALREEDALLLMSLSNAHLFARLQRRLRGTAPMSQPPQEEKEKEKEEARLPQPQSPQAVASSALSSDRSFCCYDNDRKNNEDHHRNTLTVATHSSSSRNASNEVKDSMHVSHTSSSSPPPSSSSTPSYKMSEETKRAAAVGTNAACPSSSSPSPLSFPSPTSPTASSHALCPGLAGPMDKLLSEVHAGFFYACTMPLSAVTAVREVKKKKKREMDTDGASAAPPHASSSCTTSSSPRTEVEAAEVRAEKVSRSLPSLPLPPPPAAAAASVAARMSSLPSPSFSSPLPPPSSSSSSSRCAGALAGVKRRRAAWLAEEDVQVARWLRMGAAAATITRRVPPISDHAFTFSITAPSAAGDAVGGGQAHGPRHEWEGGDKEHNGSNQRNGGNNNNDNHNNNSSGSDGEVTTNAKESDLVDAEDADAGGGRKDRTGRRSGHARRRVEGDAECVDDEEEEEEKRGREKKKKGTTASAASHSAGLVAQSMRAWETHLSAQLAREGGTLNAFRQGRNRTSYVERQRFQQAAQWNEYQQELRLEDAMREQNRRRARQRNPHAHDEEL